LRALALYGGTCSPFVNTTEIEISPEMLMLVITAGIELKEETAIEEKSSKDAPLVFVFHKHFEKHWN
jgi:hypothetical protein